jgi:VanZ family protein
MQRRTRIIYIIIIATVLAAVLCFIWGNSLLDGGASRKLSSAVTEFIRPIYELFTDDPVTDSTLHAFIRKAAHFLEFAAIAVAASLLLWRLRGEHLVQNLMSVLFGSLFIAVTDEYIQSFSPGRSSSVRDVVIDFAGAAVGALAVFACIFIIRKIKKTKIKNKELQHETCLRM